jgi:hypothetical protein
MANYPQELAQDAVCQSHTGHMTGLWFLSTRPLRLNTNEWMNFIFILRKTLLNLMGFACVPKTCDTLTSTLSDFWYAVRNSWTVVQFCFMLEAWKDCTPISGHFLMKPEHYEMKITSVVTLTEQYRWHKRLRAGLTNLWHAYPKWRAERYSCHPAFAVTPIIFYSFCPTDVSILWRIRTYVHTHTHARARRRSVYELTVKR